ncbi:MAG: hypothetical protein DRG83_15375, partial [Deltaproteobacteria bacterium]
MRRFRQGYLMGLLCTFFIFFLSTSVLAITTSGTLTENETWSGTVVLTGDVTVPEGVTLTIEPGTQVIFPARSDDTGGGDPNVTELIVNGSLVATGNDSNKITFTSGGAIPTPGDWGGIKCSVSLDLEYCVLEYPVKGITCSVNGGEQSLTIKNCEIKHTEDTGIYIYGESGAKIASDVSNNVLSDIGGHGISGYVTGSGTEISGSFSGNTVSDCGGYGIIVQAVSSAASSVDIRNNDVSDIDDSGIYEQASYGSISGKIEGNTITNAGRDTNSSYRYGIWVSSGRGSNDIEVSNNTVTNTGSHGIYVSTESYSSASVTVKNNTVHDINGNVGIYCYERYGNLAVEVSNNEVRNAGHGIFCKGYDPSSSEYGLEALISGNNVHDNSGSGIYCHEEFRGHVNAEIRGNTVYRNDGNGIVCSRNTYYGNYVSALITLNSVHDNGSNGIYSNTTYTTQVVYNTIYQNSDYDLYNASSLPIDARFNYWGDTTTAEMDNNSGLTNINKIFDQFDDSGKGLANYIPWASSGFDSVSNLETKVTDPVNDSTLTEGKVVVAGVAHALSGIDRVEISIDNGNTWETAEFDPRNIGKTHWSYTFDELYAGNYTILVRVVDVDGNVQDPATETRISIKTDEPTRVGTLEWDETWSGTVQLYGDVTVPEGVTLTILPGTHVKFPANLDTSYSGENVKSSEFIVKGTLICKGTEAEPILFTSDAGENAKKGDWVGIKAEGTLRLENTTVEYSRYGI